MCALSRMQDWKTLQPRICESSLAGGYYYKYTGSWERGNCFRKVLHGYVIFNNYGQCFREVIALKQNFVRLGVQCYSDSHVRTLLNFGVECRLKSRSFIWGTLLPLREQLKHINIRLSQHQMLVTEGDASFKQLILE